MKSFWLFLFCYVAVAALREGGVEAQIPQKFVYKGSLELNGAPAEGNFEMMFFLTRNRRLNEGTEQNAEWWERHADDPTTDNVDERVNVTNGTFSVVLGERNTIQNVQRQFGGEHFFIRSDQPIYLGVKVWFEDNWHRLDPLQELLPMPYAIASSKGLQFYVTGEQLENENSRVPLRISDNQEQMRLDGDDISSENTLHLQRLGNRVTEVHGALNVNQNITTSANVDIAGNATVEGVAAFNGRLQANDGVDVQNDLTAFGNLSVRGASSVNGGLEVSEGITVRGGANITSGNVVLNNGTITGFLESSAEAENHIQGEGGEDREVTIPIIVHSGSSICFITQSVTNDVHQNQSGGCEIEIFDPDNSARDANNNPVGNGNYWGLKAYAYGSDTDTFCRARCLSW